MQWWEGPTVEELKAERFGRMGGAGKPRCEFCGGSVDPEDRRTWKQVSGWQKNRGNGEGVRPLLMRSAPQAFAHTHCLDAQRHGGTQQEMFG